MSHIILCLHSLLIPIGCRLLSLSSRVIIKLAVAESPAVFKLQQVAKVVLIGVTCARPRSV